MPRRSTGPHTDTKLRVTIVNWLRPSITLCARGHLKLKCLVDLVRAVVNERDVIDAFTCVAPCPLLVIQLMPLRFIPSSAGAGWPSVGGAAASSLAGSPTAIATATESPNFASGQAEERAQCGKEEHSTRIQPSPRPSISRSGTGSNKVSSVLRNMRGE
jgi:hypothetical protein